MSNVLVSEVVHHLEILPSNLQNYVLTFVQALSRPFRNERIQAEIKHFSTGVANQPLENAGQRLAMLAGTISVSDLDLMSQAIEEDCGRVDINEW